MNNLQKMGGIAALYMATAYMVGIVLFLFVLDYPNMVDPAQKVGLLVDKQALIYLMNLMLYVVFGVFLIVMVLSLYERLKVDAILQVATIIGIIWAGSLIASGMVANAGIAPVIALYAKDPAQAALTWLEFETVANGLGNGNGEILGGLMTLLINWSALRSGGLPGKLNYLGVVVGSIGIISTIPGLSDLTALFGITQIVWFVWLAGTLLRSDPNTTLVADRGLVSVK